MEKNILLMTDSYKVTHYLQYPEKTETVFSYFESRGGDFPNVTFFGLHYFLKEYLMGTVVTPKKIQQAKELFDLHFGVPLFNEEGWNYIYEKHKGRLPISIKAVPEGSTIPGRNVLMTIENTDPNCFWLTNYLETLLVQVWYPCTVATQSRHMKMAILHFLQETGDPSLIDFKLHDFGFRGVSSPETAALGGAAHLINFLGTDTFAGVQMAREYYGAEMAGFSIPASEHSTITSWGAENELEAMRNMLQKYPKGLVACVSDSFDIYRACTEYWGRELKMDILARDGVLVVRPDSGDPLEVLVKVLNILGEQFGTTTNTKGYKVLNPKIRVIQGDGIDRNSMTEILETIKKAGFSADNLAFGSGGGLLQKLNRDTLKFAFKCSSVTVNGEERDVFKNPVTDNGKQSKKGRLKLVNMNGTFKTVRESDMPHRVEVTGNPQRKIEVTGNPQRKISHEEFAEALGAEPVATMGGQDCLQEVFLDGTILNQPKWEEIRERAKL